MTKLFTIQGMHTNILNSKLTEYENVNMSRTEHDFYMK